MSLPETRLFLAFFAILTLAGCTSTAPEDGPLTPFPEAALDPGDEVLAGAVQEFLLTTEAPNASQYEFSRMDLDDDGRPRRAMQHLRDVPRSQ